MPTLEEADRMVELMGDGHNHYCAVQQILHHNGKCVCDEAPIKSKVDLTVKKECTCGHKCGKDCCSGDSHGHP